MARRERDKEELDYSERLAEALGHTIKVLRTDQQLGRRDLAEKAKISYSYITMIENGDKPPSPSVLGPIAQALGMRMTDLLAIAEERMETRHEERTPIAAEEASTQRPPQDSRPPRPSSTGAYAMQPSLRGSRRDLRSAVLELEQLMQQMDPEDVGRLLDYAQRLAR